MARGEISALDSEVPSGATTSLDLDRRSEKQTHVANSTRVGDEGPKTWNPRLLRFGPLSGICAMFLAIGSVVASLGILAGSDNQPVANWSVPPSTYLAIFTAIANLSIRYAAVQGVIIAWWSQALKGASITQLYWQWYAGTSARGALTAGRRMSVVGIACIFSIIVAVDGPLLQRASTTDLSGEMITPVSLDVKMVPLIPHGYTGTWSTSKELGEPDLPVPSFNQTIPTKSGKAGNDIWAEVDIKLLVEVIGPWMQSSPLKGVVQGCDKSCRAKLKAPALFATCETKQIPFTPWLDTVDWKKVYNQKLAPNIGHYAFITWPIFTVKQDEIIELISAHAHTSDCSGTINYTECSTTSGIGEYDVLIENNQIMMDSIPPPRLIALANNTKTNYTINGSPVPGHHSTLGGIANVLGLRLANSLAYIPIDGEMNQLALGTYPLPYIENSVQECLSFSNPLPDFLDQINTLMLYVGAYAAQEHRPFLSTRLDEDHLNEVNTTTTAFQYEQHYVFHTDYWFFLAAGLVEILCISLILPTYWGWWQLGRPVSFSPFELAKAFQSPLFSDFNSNSSARDVAGQHVAETTNLKYGVLNNETQNGNGRDKLVFDDSNSVSTPRKGMVFPE